MQSIGRTFRLFLHNRMIGKRFLLASLLMLSLVSCLSAQEPPGRLLLKPIKIEGVENALQLTDRIYSGGEPHTEQAFEELARLGIKTIVSVDGAQPELALARRYGLRYVHVPIGYDAVPHRAQLMLTRVAREIDGPVFVHCHHGQHRGPAAAAVVCIADGAVSATDAAAILKSAKTSKDYVGLWRDVAAYQSPAPSIVLPMLVEKAEVESFPAAMAKIDRHFDQLKLCRDAQWKAPADHPDLVASQEALLVYEQLRESGRHLTKDHDDEFRAWLRDSETLAKELEAALRAGKHEQAEERFLAVQKSCKQCHVKHRDR